MSIVNEPSDLEGTYVQRGTTRPGNPRGGTMNRNMKMHSSGGFAEEFRITEFLAAAAMLTVSILFHYLRVNYRKIPSIEIKVGEFLTFSRDPTYDYPRTREQIPMWLLIVLADVVPIGVYLLTMFLRQPNYWKNDTRDFLLSLLLSTATANFCTVLLKNISGRLRPNFFALCEWNYNIIWDGVTSLCQSASKEKLARQSFPSGHASCSFSGLFFLTLFLLGRSKLTDSSRQSQLTATVKIFVLFVCLCPTFLACWLAITRTLDYYHHFSDIVAGAFIGIGCAYMAYYYNMLTSSMWKIDKVLQMVQ